MRIGGRACTCRVPASPVRSTVAATGVAYLLYGYGLGTLDTATATTLTLAEPVTAAVFATVVLDERLSAVEWLGAAIVLLGLALAGARLPSRSWRA